jgi:hypothetical protein
LLAPGTPTSILGGPLAGLNALSASNPAQLHQLLSELADALSLKLENAAAYHDHLEAVIQSRRDHTRPPGAAETADVPNEAVQILKFLAAGEDTAIEHIVFATGISAPKVQYFLDVLSEEDFVEEIFGFAGESSRFVLTRRGRKHLFDRNLLD